MRGRSCTARGWPRQVLVFLDAAEVIDEEAGGEGGDVQDGVQWGGEERSEGGELGGRAERDGHAREARAEDEGVDGVGDAREGVVEVGRDARG